MRQLLPVGADDVDPLAAYAADARPTPADRPWVLINMITSIDGATAVAGLSGGLGGPADKEAFRAIRAVADVVLVAAGTLRAEHYGPVRVRDDVRRQRLERGQAPSPRLAIVSGRLDLDPTQPVFTDSEPAPLVLTTRAAAARAPAALRGRCELRVPTGADPSPAAAPGIGSGPDPSEDRVDLDAALRSLRRVDGARVVLVEGGPSLNGALVAAGLVDEVCLSLAPRLVGGTSARLAHGADPVGVESLTLHRVLTEDGILFLRYAR